MDKTKVSISEAIKMSGVSRSHFYKSYVDKGKISIELIDDKKFIDVSELIRVFGNIQLEDNKNTTENNSNTEDKAKIIELLEQQLSESKKRENQAQERERWLQSQIDELRSQQTYLLEDKTTKKRKKLFGLF